MFHRVAACAGLLLISTLLLMQRPENATGQAKKEVSLEKQVANLKQEVASLKQEVTQLQTANTQGQTSLKKATDDGKTTQTSLDGYRGAGLIHVVVLKTKSDTSGEPQSLIDDSYSQLAKIKGVRGLWAGKPSDKGTPDAKTDYDVALVLAFDDSSALKTYLNDPAHTKFADAHLKMWETPIVYDFEPRKPKP